MIESDPDLGLRWSVVESLPVAKPVKQGEGDLALIFENYRISLRNLAACGVTTVCYNFMPVLDWTRTQLATPLPGNGVARPASSARKWRSAPASAPSGT